jgi:hypothetical protein
MNIDYAELRNTADSLINDFSKGQKASLMKGEKVKDVKTGKVEKTFREVDNGVAVRTRYSEEAIAQSNGVIDAGDVKFICRFREKPEEVMDRIRYAGVDYNIIHCDPIDPTGEYVVTYIIQGRKA